MLPKALTATNRRHIPGVATTVVSGTIAVAMFVALATYGTGALLAPDNSVVFPEKAFQAFLVAGTVGGFLVCICYALVALGALTKFATKRPIDLIGALLGLRLAYWVSPRSSSRARPPLVTPSGASGSVSSASVLAWYGSPSRSGRTWRRPGITRYSTRTDADGVR
jgi:hypothetical protein